MSSLSVSRRAVLKNLVGITRATTFMSGGLLLLTACQNISPLPLATPTPHVLSDPPLVIYKGAASIVHELYWFPDSLSIASYDGNTIQIWEALTGKLLTTLSTGVPRPTWMGWSPNGKWRIFAYQVVDTQKMHPFFTLTPDKYDNGIWAWSPDSCYLAYGVSLPDQDPHLLQIREVRSGALIQTVDIAPGHIHALAWSPDGQNLAIGGSIPQGFGRNDLGVLQIWHFSGQRRQLLFSSPSFAIIFNWLSWSPDGKFLAFTGDGPQAQERSGLVDVANKKIASFFPGGVTRCLWSPADNARIALVDQKSIEIWNPLTNRVLSAYTIPPSADDLIDSIAWSPNGRYIASSTSQFVAHREKPFIMVWEPR